MIDPFPPLSRAFNLVSTIDRSRTSSCQKSDGLCCNAIVNRSSINGDFCCCNWYRKRKKRKAYVFSLGLMGHSVDKCYKRHGIHLVISPGPSPLIFETHLQFPHINPKCRRILKKQNFSSCSSSIRSSKWISVH